MSKLSAIFLVLITIDLVSAQPAVLEVPGLFGECTPQYASNSDVLSLFQSPSIEAKEIHVPYGIGWLIPYNKSAGLTRVLSYGEVRAIEFEELQNCQISSGTEGLEIQPMETATYLYYLGGGFSKVRIEDVDCQMFVEDDEILEYPTVQAWIKVLFRDGTSPGWLLNDGTQTKNAGIRC